MKVSRAPHFSVICLDSCTECSYIAVNLGTILFVEGQLFVLTLSTKFEVGGWHIDRELDSPSAKI